MLSERGADAVRATRSSSFVCDLRKWLEVMETYENGGFMYHATMPTDALVRGPPVSHRVLCTYSPASAPRFVGPIPSMSHGPLPFF